jgi:hypothetical protein
VPTGEVCVPTGEVCVQVREACVPTGEVCVQVREACVPTGEVCVPVSNPCFPGKNENRHAGERKVVPKPVKTPPSVTCTYRRAQRASR